MGYLDQPLVSEPSSRTVNLRSGRRRGDAILLAWNYARERGDLEVAEQLRLEYEKIFNMVPLTLSSNRRRMFDNISNAASDFRTWLVRF